MSNEHMIVSTEHKSTMSNENAVCAMWLIAFACGFITWLVWEKCKLAMIYIADLQRMVRDLQNDVHQLQHPYGEIINEDELNTDDE